MIRLWMFLLPLVVAALAAVTVLVLRLFIEFGNPSAFWLTVVPVFWAGLWAWRLAWRERTARELYAFGSLESQVQSFSIRRSILRFSLTVSAMFFLVVAAAEPQWGEIRRQVQRQGIDIVLAVDASRSMLAEDTAPDRLRAASDEIHQLLRSLHGDRVGLVVFAGFAFAQSPLTSDYGAIRLYLDRIRPDALPAQGTAIGRAIQESHRLLTGGDDPEFKRAPTQLILLISDGEDHETNPVAAALEAQADGIRVYTVGVGTTHGGRIPLRNARGDFEGYLTDREGKTVITALVDTQLEAIAEAGGGAYFHLDRPGATALALQQEIGRFEDAAVSSILRSHYVSRPYLSLALALFCLALALLIDERPYRQRPTTTPKWLNFFTVLLVLVALVGCTNIRHRDPHARRAIELAEAGDTDAALEALDRARVDEHNRHAFYFDRGRIQELTAAQDLAQEDYLRALASPEGSLRIMAMVGIGNTFVRQGNYEAALERYRRALTLDPSNDAARRNYEIAHRLLFPYCAALDDALEPNDRIEDAKALPAESYVGEWAQRYRDATPPVNAPALPGASSTTADEKTPLTSCGLNDDLFALPLEGGEAIQVRVKFKRLREDNGGPPLPATLRPSAVRIALLDRNGEAVAVDQGARENVSELVDAKAMTRTMDVPNIDGSRGPYYLQISSDNGLEYRYTLQVTITPPCSAVDDEFEPNDRPENASTLEPGEHKLRICNANQDWFDVAMGEGDEVFVDIRSPGSEAGITGPLAVGSTQRHASSPATAGAELRRIDPRSGFETLYARSNAAGGALRVGVENLDDYEGAYEIAVYRFAPCPVGNDRFEPNNRPSQATPLTAEQNTLRHLRLCPGDEDWYMMQLPEEAPNAAQANAEPAPKRFAALAEYADPSRALQIELWDPVTGRLIARSQPLSQTDYQSEETGSTVAFTELPEKLTSVLIRVIGDPGYYHLRFPDTQPPPNQNQSDSNAANDDNSDGDPQDSEDGEDQSDSASDPQEADDGEDQGEESQSDEGPDDQKPEQDNGPPPPAPSPQDAAAAEDEERRALMRLLESLEDNNMNLPLMQAIERQPPTRTQNEW